MHLVIVESPTKAKTIRKFLGPDFQVLASMGHVRDLPESSAEIPAEAKKTEWGALGVNVDKDFEPLYVVPRSKSKTVNELKRALKSADEVYLATDEDREGESISWHLLQVLKPKVPVHRMVFHEITKQAIEQALSHPRDIDERLVRAQEARRILDRLVGYTVSPVLWKKIAYGLSAGRVQSAVLKAIVDRERERMRFVKSSYWDVEAALEQKGSVCAAKLVTTEGRRIASGKDFDESTGKLKADPKEVALVDEALAQTIAIDAKQLPWKVTDVTEKPVTRRPLPPFITSTLQQEANRKLGLSSKEAMRTAQSLYENGFITYMRTDSTALSEEAMRAIGGKVIQRFGKEFLAPAPRHYTKSVKGAQEAHEAIRPSLNFQAPDETGLGGTERKLYELIWMRAMASQMADSQQVQMSVLMECGRHGFQATGLKIVFPGFLRAYVESGEDAEQALGDQERILPPFAVGDVPRCTDAKAVGHETKPPARFTEAGLVQFMEKEGIGRPSTYATVISTLLDRHYVFKAGNALVPSFTGFAVTQYLENHFRDLVDVHFTSNMEEVLDEIAQGQKDWLAYLQHFYSDKEGLKEKVQTESARQEGEETRLVVLPNLRGVQVRVGRFGPYFEAEHPKSHTMAKASIPLDVAPADFTQEKMASLLEQAQQGPTTLGHDPASGLNIYLKTGSYGPYLQLGEDPPEGDKKAKKPKRVSIPKNIPLDTLSHDKALAILSLPRLLGTHPQSGKEVRAGLGRFGPYVVHDGDFRSLKKEDDVLTVDLARALALLAVPKGTRGGKVLKIIGEHPKDHKPVTLHEGKFGIYVKHGKTNATVPKGEDPNALTLDQALELLKARKTRKK